MIEREVMKDVPINAVRQNPDNPRLNDAAVGEVIKSIQQSDYISPIIVDEALMIMAGNTRHKAMQQMGKETIPIVIKITGLTDEQKRRFILADNKAQEFSEWDFEKLGIFSEMLLQDVGFSDTDIDKIMNPDDQDKDIVPELRENVDVKLGDIFDIGPHRLFCGSSTDRASYALLMDGRMAQMVFTDPPYNVDYQGSTNTHGQNKREGIANDNMTDEDFAKFLNDALIPMLEFCDGVFYICMSAEELGNLRNAFEAAGGHWQSYLIWVKNTFTLSRSDWQNQYEPIMYGWNGKTKDHYFAGWRDEGNVWEGLDKIHPHFDGTKTVIRVGEYMFEFDGKVTGKMVSKKGEVDIWREKKPSKNKFHPTEKPIPLIKKAIEASSRRHNIVLDPFGGSGTTMIAAHETGRIATSIELDPRFCDVILRRMHALDPNLMIKCNGTLMDASKLKLEG